MSDKSRTFNPDAAAAAAGPGGGGGGGGGARGHTDSLTD